MTKTKIERKRSPQPEMIGRADHEHGRWTVGDSPAARGIPHTDLHNRKMVAPHGEGELDRVIRGHEMMHAKVSPTPAEFMHFISREVASQASLIAVEEARVNSLCSRVGIPVDKYLTDGTEKAAGKKLAELKDMTQLVHGSVACAGTVGGVEFIKGVRSVDKGLAKVLANIQKQVMKNIDAVIPSELGRVTVGDNIGGFAHTERIAEWVDTLIEKMEDEQDKNEDEDQGEDEDEGEDEGETKSASKPSSSVSKPVSDPTKVAPRPARSTVPSWGKLNIKKLPMPEATRGNLGKKRVAS